MSDANSWAQQRRENARVHAQRLAERKRAESSLASQHLQRFAAAARRHRLDAEQLFAISPQGKRAHTGLQGWYLRADGSAGVDVEGNYYILARPLGLWDRINGVTLSPSDPPLVLGAGGRDGESMDLTARLSEILPQWREIVDDNVA